MRCSDSFDESACVLDEIAFQASLFTLHTVTCEYECGPEAAHGATVSVGVQANDKIAERVCL